MSDAATSETEGRRGRKSPSAFRTISEVATELDVPQHVLRFWESKFSQVKPLKRGGGRRYYRPEDVALLERIRTLLYQDGYTIKGVQKVLRDSNSRKSGNKAEEKPASEKAGQGEPAMSALKRRDLEAIAEELGTLRDLLRRRKR